MKILWRLYVAILERNAIKNSNQIPPSKCCLSWPTYIKLPHPWSFVQFNPTHLIPRDFGFMKSWILFLVLFLFPGYLPVNLSFMWPLIFDCYVKGGILNSFNITITQLTFNIRTFGRFIYFNLQRIQWRVKDISRMA